MDYLELIKKRQSVRNYRPDEVDDEKINIILEAARLAPTAANKQAFKIIVIHTKGREDELRKIYNRDWFVKAPVVIGVCSIPKESWVRSDGKNYSDVDAAIVMDHIVLAATDLGLGTCWVGAFNKNAAREVFNLDSILEPIAFTPVGYAVALDSKKFRKDMSEIIIKL